MSYADLIGIPFVLGGRSRAGMDCCGLVIEVYRRLGIEVADLSDYATAQDAAPRFCDILRAAWKKVEPPYELNDVLVFDVDGSGAATHCAVWLGNDRMLHAIDKVGVAVAQLRRFRRFFLGAWRREVPCPA